MKRTIHLFTWQYNLSFHEIVPLTFNTAWHKHEDCQFKYTVDCLHIAIFSNKDLLTIKLNLLNKMEEHGDLLFFINEQAVKKINVKCEQLILSSPAT